MVTLSESSLVLCLIAALPFRGAAASLEPNLAVPVVFFPPEPPVYGARIAEHPARTRHLFRGQGLNPPGGMADFAGDNLYPALAARLFAGTLHPELEAKIEAYRRRRNEFLNPLLDRLVTLHAAAEDGRERELRAFAEQQTPAIAAWEQEADELRRELTHSRLGFDLNWNAKRPWTLDSFSGNQDWLNYEAEFQVMRAAAFYEDGLLPEQRGLLRELAIELDARARKVRGEPYPRDEFDAMFFSPEGARLRLPPHLPRDVLEQIGRFNGRKNELKRRLRATVREQEKVSRSERAAAYARLADEQWPEIRQVEELAEELRTKIAPSFVPAPPEKPPAIPAWLIEVIHEYNEDRDTYFGEMRHAMQAATGRLAPPDSRDSDARLREEEAYAARRREAERQAVVEFQQENEERFTNLRNRYRAIHDALETIATRTRDASTGKRLNVEMLLQQHTAAMAEFDRYGRASAIFSNYRTAMLQRGLSPEQRRLLFSSAVAALAQPLPFGEPLPRRNVKYPLPR